MADPAEVHAALLAQSHWGWHAVLMCLVWLGLVPACITVMRFGKPRPSAKGIRPDVSLWQREWWFFSVHKFGLGLAMALAAGGGIAAYALAGAYSGSVHATFGLLAILLGLGQVISSQFRGSRGGKYREGADPEDPATWRGDQYDRTIKRRIFEAVHKFGGYFAVLFSVGAVGSGLMQYHVPGLTVAVVMAGIGWGVLWVVLDFKGRAFDGYRAAHGYGLEHPYNKKREFL